MPVHDPSRFLGCCSDAVRLVVRPLARSFDRVSGDADESSDAQGRRAATDGPFLMCFDKLEDFASTVQQLPLAVQLVQVTLAPRDLNLTLPLDPDLKPWSHGKGFFVEASWCQDGPVCQKLPRCSLAFLRS